MVLSRLPSVTESQEETRDSSLKNRRNRSANNLHVTINTLPEEIGGEDNVFQSNYGTGISRTPSILTISSHKSSKIPIGNQIHTV